jgi:hypothetical protein
MNVLVLFSTEMNTYYREKASIFTNKRSRNIVCSCRGNISRESQLHHESKTAKPMLNFSGKQISQLHIGLTAAASFSTYQRSNTKANSFLDSHDQPLAAKVSAESSMSLPFYTTDCMSPL